MGQLSAARALSTAQEAAVASGFKQSVKWVTIDVACDVAPLNPEPQTGPGGHCHGPSPPSLFFYFWC